MLSVIPPLETALRHVMLSKGTNSTLSIPVDVLQELNAHWEDDQASSDPIQSLSMVPRQAVTYLLDKVMPIWARQIQHLRLCGQPVAHKFPLSIARDRRGLPVNLAWFDLCEWLHLIQIELKILIDLDAVSNQLGGLMLTRCRPPDRDWAGWWARFSWDNLHTLSLGRNNLRRIDWPLDRVCPNLQRLDLSYNRLSSFSSALHLPRLRVLLLSFNEFRFCPDLRGLPQLQTLHLAYNSLERLNGLEVALQLRVLNVSANMLLHHDTLSPLSRLRWLRSLDLQDNPLSCVSPHRELTLAWISPHVDTEAFVLDRGPLSPSDKLLVGLARELTVERQDLDQAQIYQEPVTKASSHRRGTRVRSRLREVVIAEPSHELPEPVNVLRQTSVDNPFAEEEPEYLQTKRKVDALREAHGQSGWLHSVGGQELNNILGISRASVTAVSPALNAESIKEQEAKRQDIEKFVEQASEQLRRTKCPEPINNSVITPVPVINSVPLEIHSEDETAPVESTVIPRQEQEPIHITPSPEEPAEKSSSSHLEDSDELQPSFYSKYAVDDDDGDAYYSSYQGPKLAVVAVQVDTEDTSQVTLDLCSDYITILNQLQNPLLQKSTHLLTNVEIVETDPPTLEFTFRSDGSLACMEPFDRYRFSLSEVDLSQVLDFVQPFLAEHRLAMARAIRRMNCLVCQKRFKLGIDQPLGKE